MSREAPKFKVSTFSVVRHPRKDAYLLTLETGEKSRGRLGHIGGGVDAGIDKTPVQANVREGDEEAKVVLIPRRHLATFYFPNPEGPRLHLMFEADHAGEPETSDEHPFHGYFGYDTIVDLDEHDVLRNKGVLHAINLARRPVTERVPIEDSIITIVERPAPRRLTPELYDMLAGAAIEHSMYASPMVDLDPAKGLATPPELVIPSNQASGSL